MFTRDDASWLAETVHALYSIHDVYEFGVAVMTAFEAKFRLHSFACEEMNPGISLYRLHALRCATPPPLDHVAYLHDNPMGWIFGAATVPPVLHMRADVAFSSWRRTDHFNGIARPMGWSDQIIIVARSTPSFVFVSLHRDAEFTGNERELAAILRPHITAAWSRVFPHSGLRGRLGAQPIPLSRQLRPLELSAEQVRLLRAYFPRWRSPGELPAEMGDWLRRSMAALRAQPTPLPLTPFKTESARGRLIVRCFTGRAGDAMQLQLVETPPDPDFSRLRERGLTPRECEMLHWMAQGKRDSEIATIVGVAPRTVGKHVEHILQKLGSENRGAAVGAAEQWLRQSHLSAASIRMG